MRSFTHNELAQYNGQEGRPAYIGVRGNVYDVSEVPSTVMFSAMIYQMSPINKQPKSIHRFQNFQLSEN
mgnify:CR=1 FL=1